MRPEGGIVDPWRRLGKPDEMRNRSSGRTTPLGLPRRPLGWMGTATALIFTLVVSGIDVSRGQSTVGAAVPSTGDGYVGSSACARCHAALFKSFSQTAMGRSMEAISPEVIASSRVPAETFDVKLDRHFSVFAKDGEVYQSEFQTAPDAAEVFRDTRLLRWKIGAGENGFGAIVEREHTLFQAPLSYYTRSSEWGLSPGYEFGDYGFSRPILPGCVSCHSGRPLPIANTNGRYAEPAFSQLAIGCENCHGPGAEHIRRMNDIRAHKASGDPAIVNPIDLPMPLANQICMSCHELGDVRVYKAGKTYQDFRPGTPLDSVVSLFLVPPKPESPPEADHLEHYYAMTLSKCYRASGGKMGCITCHDPHVEPSAQEVPAYFNPKCITCHTTRRCSRVRENGVQAKSGNDGGDCVACHMPKRDIRMISHSTVTNHRILARPDEGFPVAAFRATTEVLPDLIHLDPDPSAANDAVPLIVLLQAYGELALNRPEFAAPYLRVLTALEKTEANHAVVQASLGRRDLMQGKYREAVEHLRKALDIGAPQAAEYGDLAQAEVAVGDLQQACGDLIKGIELDPFNPILQKNLVVQLIALKRYPEAREAIDRYLDRFPQDSTMRKALQMAQRASETHP